MCVHVRVCVRVREFESRVCVCAYVAGGLAQVCSAGFCAVGDLEEG